MWSMPQATVARKWKQFAGPDEAVTFIISRPIHASRLRLFALCDFEHRRMLQVFVLRVILPEWFGGDLVSLLVEPLNILIGNPRLDVLPHSFSCQTLPHVDDPGSGTI